MGDKDSCNGDDPKNQCAEHNYFGQAERADLPLVNRGDSGPDPSVFGRKNFETGALHAGRDSS